MKKTPKKKSVGITVGITVGESVLVCGEIEGEMIGNFIMNLNEADLSIEKPKDCIEVKIHSPGGNAEDALGMYDAMRSTRHRIVTVVYGVAESAAVVLTQAGDVRLMAEHSRLMLHPIRLSTMDSSVDEITEYTKQCSKLFDAYCRLISERSGLGFDKVRAICAKETYISAHEALQLGLCDAILPMRSF
jgi:ATP-dependent Clp endopeptidase proteolytic subunit ClpP